MPSPRRSLLDLAPLELDCMNTLWPMGEGTVREIRDRLAERRPRAYTTIMTIMDRLARKGVVERIKVGRAYRYRPNLSAEDARAQALRQVVECFFGGSKEALLAQLQPAASPSAPPRARAAAATAGSTLAPAPVLATVNSIPPILQPEPAAATPVAEALADGEPIDETLL
ncbi:MAG TPA: BlaI/MecI/CopY family transcriptional regulator [Candidatus Limnocylindrales bacterium]|nr:BlaI/MecI/CopY family transcriptional regulator [Candidatus Limnocylindrales bacterium]